MSRVHLVASFVNASGRKTVAMRILVISGRFPEHGNGSREARIRGDQVRAFTHIRHLAEAHALTVIAAAPPSSPSAIHELEQMAKVHVCPVSKARRAMSAVRCLAAGRPAQVGWMMPGTAWNLAEKAAAESDVALAMTTRSVRGPLACPFVVDHVDALSRNLTHRASGIEPLPIRLFARLEASLMRRWERRVATFVDGQIAASADEAVVLPPPVAVIPVAWRGGVFREPQGHERDYDVVISGDMRYPPNREAVATLADEILPRVRVRRPATTAIVVGRAAKSLRVRGADVASDVPDLASYLRRARVAVVPLMRGPMGAPYKTIEAAASGAAIVATPWAVDCFGLPARKATTADEFADEIVSLLDDETSRRRLASESVAIVEQYLTDAVGRRLETLLVETATRHSETRK